MNTPAPAADPTLTWLPHVLGILTGTVAGFLTGKLGLTASDAAPLAATISGFVGAAVTSGVHWLEAKFSAASKTIGG